MLLPGSLTAAASLFLLSLVCLSLWPNLYKRTEVSWRFELFSLDFAVAALLTSLLAAYSLGSFGADMSFSDKLLIAGRLVAAYLLVSIRLIGMTFAYLIAFSSAGFVFAVIRLRQPAPLYFAAAAALLALSLILCWLALRKFAFTSHSTRSFRGFVLAFFSGLALAMFTVVIKLTSDPEFGPGPYASILMVSVGLVAAAPFLNFFFMNIKIIGAPIGYGHYFRGGLTAHGPGFGAGVLFAVGALASFLLFGMAAHPAVSAASPLATVAGSAGLCVLAGLLRWREFQGKTKAKSLALLALALSLTAGAALVFRLMS